MFDFDKVAKCVSEYAKVARDIGSVYIYTCLVCAAYRPRTTSNVLINYTPRRPRPLSRAFARCGVRRLMLIVYINISQQCNRPSKSFLIKETFDAQMDETGICLTLSRRYSHVKTTMPLKRYALH